MSKEFESDQKVTKFRGPGGTVFSINDNIFRKIGHYFEIEKWVLFSSKSVYVKGLLNGV